MRTKFVVIIMLQVLLLTGIIAYREYWVRTGEKIVLKTVPVDPRDIFRGDYVHLNYEITNLDLDKLKAKDTFKMNDKAYVSLIKSSDGTWRASSVSKTIPSGQCFIQGRAREQLADSLWEVTLRDKSGVIHKLSPRMFSIDLKGEELVFCREKDNAAPSFFVQRPSQRRSCDSGTAIAGIVEDIRETKYRRLNVEYGIESYFVEEGKGKAIEMMRNDQGLNVEVSLKKDGKGIITGLIIDGKKAVY